MSSMGFVSPFYPTFITAKALGVSVTKDLIALAFVNDNGLADVEVFAHKASAAFRSVPEDSDFRDQINPLQIPGEKPGETMNLDVKGLLNTAIAKGSIVGFASSDIPLASKKSNATFYDITNDDPLMKQLLQPGGKMADDSFLQGMNGDINRQLRAEIVRHFYAQAGKSWNTKGVRLDAALAVARAFVALEKSHAK